MNEDNISWSAPEHEYREHGADWYWAMSIITVSLAIAFVLVGNMLLAVIILIGVSTLLFHSKNPPRILEYKISKHGIRAGKTLYQWPSLHSFWILEKEEGSKDYHEPKLLIISKKPFVPHVTIPLNEFIVEDVRDTMRSMLPEEPRVEPLAERLARKAGF